MKYCKSKPGLKCIEILTHLTQNTTEKLGLIIIIRYFIGMVTLRNKGNSHTILTLVEISVYLISPDAPRISYVYSDNTDGISKGNPPKKMDRIVLFPDFTRFPHVAPRVQK